jgi:tetratricopeptide (TPR) repeat protein
LLLQRSLQKALAAALLAALAGVSVAAPRVSDAEREKALAFYKDARGYAATYEFHAALGSARQAQAFDPSSLEIKTYIQRILRVIETFEDRLRSGGTTHVFREGLSRYVAADHAASLLCLGAALGARPLDETLRRFIAGVEKESGRTLDPEDVRPPKELAALRLEQAEQDFNERRFQRARLRCLDAVVLEPDNALAYTRLGSVHYALGDKLGAREAWRQARALNPEDQDVREHLEKLERELP